ncbi:PREDICTED: probable carboxylesterase 9 [Nelumbo nucifera]|uniref:Alpha/beta hydrolase fold-3 domain-containing protein n=2 Tax=Nelumbo nucifera TaxID=4432 RepID=A0A822XHV0_NELNU|nr:PREDICTED: probable carboxylesterase 9 [Nelumbo nucifera]DAD18711.1 TPA_asm: hypothetical protein HUJ06_020174 [Nelumbo nucifera]
MANERKEEETKCSIDPYEHLSIVLNPDGTLTRLKTLDKVEAVSDTKTAASASVSGRNVLSKDVTLNAERNTWVRIFRPVSPHANDQTVVGLPLIIYFHGGNWVLNSADTIFCHDFCECFARIGPAVIISVNFRLPPEHRLPAAYEDAEDALVWVKNQAIIPNGDPWLRNFADFSRCFLAGWSTGGNIAFHARLRSLDLDLKPLKIVGTVLDQPVFGGTQRTRSEKKYANDQILPLKVTDLMWELALPIGANRDHQYCNPMLDANLSNKVGSIGKVLVRGYGGEVTIDRQLQLVEKLLQRGVKVEARFDDVGFHGIDLIDPRRAMNTLDIAKHFMLNC